MTRVEKDLGMVVEIFLAMFSSHCHQDPGTADEQDSEVEDKITILKHCPACLSLQWQKLF